MIHEAQLMRLGALLCIETVKSVSGKQLSALNTALKKICKRKEEISADVQHMPTVNIIEVHVPQSAKLKVIHEIFVTV